MFYCAPFLSIIYCISNKRNTSLISSKIPQNSFDPLRCKFPVPSRNFLIGGIKISREKFAAFCSVANKRKIIRKALLKVHCKSGSIAKLCLEYKLVQMFLSEADGTSFSQWLSKTPLHRRAWLSSEFPTAYEGKCHWSQKFASGLSNWMSMKYSNVDVLLEWLWGGKQHLLTLQRPQLKILSTFVLQRTNNDGNVEPWACRLLAENVKAT